MTKLINKHFKLTEDDLQAIYALQSVVVGRPKTETHVIKSGLRAMWFLRFPDKPYPGTPTPSETPEKHIENDGGAGL